MSLAACGSGGSNTSTKTESQTGKALTKEDGVIGGKLEDGSYKMISLNLDGVDADRLIDSFEASGVNTDLVVNGTDIVMLEVSYTLRNGRFVRSNEEVQYAVKGNTVTTLDSDNTLTVFEKK